MTRIHQYPSPNWRPGREGHVPLGVVVHTTVGSFSATIGWFANPESRVSAHYLVALDGRVAQFIEEGDTALHAGVVHSPTAPLVTAESPNLYTIGIEFEDGGDPADVHRPDEQYRSGADLIRAIADQWGIELDRDHVVGHREIYARKTCPGNLDIDRLLREAQPASRSRGPAEQPR